MCVASYVRKLFLCEYEKNKLGLDGRLLFHAL